MIRPKPKKSKSVFKYWKIQDDGSRELIMDLLSTEPLDEVDKIFERQFGIDPSKSRDIVVTVGRWD